jgi:hypothetical protein
LPLCELTWKLFGGSIVRRASKQLPFFMHLPVGFNCLALTISIDNDGHVLYKVVKARTSKHGPALSSYIDKNSEGRHVTTHVISPPSARKSSEQLSNG